MGLIMGLVQLLAWVTTPPIQPVPEPTTLALVGLGLGGLAWAAKRKKP